MTSTNISSEIVEVAKNLIEIESIESKPTELKRIIDFAEQYLCNNTNLYIKRFEVNGKHSLVATLKDTKTPEIFFHNHLDVVPGKPGQFKPYVKDGKLFGRGASDTKGNGAALLVLAKGLSNSDKENPHGANVGFMFTTDEEVGGHNGTKYLLEKGYRCKFFLTLEPTGFNIVPAHKGILWVTVTVKGKSAHSSRPWDGENAVLKAISGIENLYKAFPTPTKRSWLTTVNLSGIKAGDAFNKVPDECEIKFDIRRTDADDVQKIVNSIKESFKRSDVKVLEDEPLMNTDFNSPYILKLSKIVKDISKSAPSVHKGNGACDGRFYAAIGIPAIQFGTASKGLHSDNEYLECTKLEDFYNILYSFSTS